MIHFLALVLALSVLMYICDYKNSFMRVYYDLKQLPAFKKPVLTIGTFDGVHKGHQAILEKIKKRALECQGESVIITFDPHPRMVLGHHGRIALIQTLEEKIKALEQLGIDNLVVVPFTQTFAEQSAEEYISQFLIHYFKPHYIIIGYDHQFGKNRSGNFKLLEYYKDIYHYFLEEIPMQELLESGISSTKIRTAIEAGDLSTAHHFLGHHYTFSGKVEHGDQRGRLLGYPTANIEIENKHKLIPAMGVYAVYVFIEEKKYHGMMNIGIRPTVTNSLEKKIEVHLFDFNQQIYDSIIRIECIEKIRDEKKFENVEALKSQLAEDEKTVRNLF